MLEAHEEPNTAARLLRLMKRDGSAVPLVGECDVARGLVHRAYAEWFGPLRIVPTMRGLLVAAWLEVDDG